MALRKWLARSQGVVPIAVASRIRDLRRLRRQHGPGRWRKCKGGLRLL